MFKLIGIVIALIPVFLFLRNIFGRSPAVKHAISEFQKQIDYLVWVILFLIAVGLVYSLVNLFHPLSG
jgi:ABC-type phosphate/phosphonate transport system permease subunit